MRYGNVKGANEVEKRKLGVGYSFVDVQRAPLCRTTGGREKVGGVEDRNVYELSGHPKANAIRFSKRAVTISVQIGSPGCLMVNLAVAFLSAEVKPS